MTQPIHPCADPLYHSLQPHSLQLRRWRQLGTLVPCCLAVLASACAGTDLDYETLEAEPLGSIEQAFVGTAPTVTSNENLSAPFASAVKLTLAGGALCSGVKIGTNRYLTAAHCLTEGATSIGISNALSGSTTSFSLVPGKIFVHPSFQLGDEGLTTGNNNLYDVAMFDVVAGPTFPATPVTGQLITNGTALTGVGYGRSGASGCSANDGVKRKASFTAAPDGVLNSTRFVHRILDAGTPSNCEGDSGGPVFLGSGANAKVVGLVSGSLLVPSDPTLSLSLHTRLSNVFEWINDPVDSTLSPVPSTLIKDQSGVYLMNATLGASGKPLLNCAAMNGTSGGAVRDVRLHSCDGFIGEFSGNSPGWRLFISGQDSSGRSTFKLINRNSSLCLGVDPNLPVINLRDVSAFPCAASGSGLNSQRWAFEPVAPQNSGNATAYRLRNQLNASFCMATEPASGADNADVVLFNCSAGENRKWFVTR